MSELKNKKASPLKGKGINELDNSEVSEETFYVLNRKIKNSKKSNTAGRKDAVNKFGRKVLKILHQFHRPI